MNIYFNISLQMYRAFFIWSLLKVVYWIDLNKNTTGMQPFWLIRMSKAPYLINLQLYQTMIRPSMVEGTENRFEVVIS